MEDMEEIKNFWSGKKVFITGHTGFKGSWLSLLLRSLGADVCGYALAPDTEPNLFTLARIEEYVTHCLGNILDIPQLQKSINAFNPEVVFHLSAQALVRPSYTDPIGTFNTNIIGTANMLQAVRKCSSVKAVVVITTDKCYEQMGVNKPFTEADRLGGADPYSASKACAELVVTAMRNSFFPPAQYQTHGVAIATARAGNVIGGGDWAQDRLIPDAVRAIQSGKELVVRNPSSVRPWQHVLDPLHGYLVLAEKLYKNGVTYGEAWNFGPEDSSAQPVSLVIDKFRKKFGDKLHTTIADQTLPAPHEAQTLRLSCLKAKTRLDWQPKLTLDQSLTLTVDWYSAFLRGEDIKVMTNKQIKQFEIL